MKTPIYTGLLQSDLDATGFKLINLPAPTSTGDAANKAYVDAHAGGGGGSGLPQGWVSVMDYGAHADGVTDDTAAAHAAIAAATAVVYFPPGNYFFAGSIGVVPANISLMGGPFLGPHGNVVTTVATYLPNNHLSPTAGGTCFLLTANAGSVTVANSFIKLSDNSSVTGITFYWPNQLTTSAPPTSYPWAIYLGTGAGSSVKYCNFVNAFQGIYIENTMFSLIEEVRGQCLAYGIRCEGNFDVTRLRGVHLNASWDYSGAAGTWQSVNGIAYEFGRNDLIILEDCFAFFYYCWLHFYNDPTHNVPGPPPIPATWGQIRGGGGDQCVLPVWVQQVQDQGIDLDGVHLSSPSGHCVQIDSGNSGSVRIHNSMMFGTSGSFGTVAGSGEVTVEDTYCFGSNLSGGTGTTTFATTGWAVTGTGNFKMNGCNFRTTQTHVSLGASLTRAVVTGNICSDTFVVSNSVSAGNFVIDGNTGQGTVYVGSDFRLVAITGGAKLQARNPGTNTWVDADQWTNP